MMNDDVEGKLSTIVPLLVSRPRKKRSFGTHFMKLTAGVIPPHPARKVRHSQGCHVLIAFRQIPMGRHWSKGEHDLCKAHQEGKHMTKQ